MASGFPGLFVHPTLSIGSSVAVLINTDNNNDGVPSKRLYPYSVAYIIIILDALFDQYALGRRSFTDDQAAIYQTVEERLATIYGLDGKVCVQRFICELTKYPIKDYTVIGELLTLVFSPRQDGSDLMQEYLDAQQTGEVEHSETCTIAYGNDCPVSIFNYFNKMDSSSPGGPQPPPSAEYHSSYGYNNINNEEQPIHIGFKNFLKKFGEDVEFVPF
ncbi:hypothetical protein Pcinc_027970 [Petrolisthes cinctipes]|uniref:Uncharacterized protein n=1 Tax=Petrolisthes cinctipes TaxID=88211 RepID=A0AAE1F3C3_PETCI|nr:hypothetical protein Pcinc_027970 [Petrolisthes cinctipes]